MPTLPTNYPYANVNQFLLHHLNLSVLSVLLNSSRTLPTNRLSNNAILSALHLQNLFVIFSPSERPVSLISLKKWAANHSARRMPPMSSRPMCRPSRPCQKAEAASLVTSCGERKIPMAAAIYRLLHRRKTRMLTMPRRLGCRSHRRPSRPTVQ